MYIFYKIVVFFFDTSHMQWVVLFDVVALVYTTLYVKFPLTVATVIFYV